ncbi:MAG TPA: circularly permuted type 2 ATP-grasp protein [Polyangia bacterium]|nr:circularly permuted type 2 ATP-grasp protein [Polyangia bacterium]
MVANLLANMNADTFARCQALAELALAQRGVTFSVYSDDRGTEKVMPVCLVPRVIGAAEWARLEKGLVQRLTALQLFLDDLYGEQRVLREHVIPTELIVGSKHYLPQLRGMKPPGGVRIHIAGIDLIRSPDGVLRVLEDNLRTPSGVSYVIENRLVTKRVFPAAMDRIGVRRVDDYPTQLVETLRSVSPEDPARTTIVVLTPGPFNSAYFEHSFLARSMGIELVEASDLFVSGDEVFVKTTLGPRRVHVIYRRTDDAYIDPEFFRPDSMLGVPGLMRAWAAGKVTLANAPGNGVADDKAIYPYVPDLIRFFLGEEPIIEQVPTYICARPADRSYVLAHLSELVVKAVDEAGGYGMLMGPEASAAELDMFRDRIRADPRRYIAQHRVELSTCPTWIAEERRIEPRRIDLRPFILTGKNGSWVLPGGLTRVALRAGSYVVNSSQGGGSKDTWVQADTAS